MRWDFSVNVDENLLAKKFFTGSWSFGVYNVLGRDNVYSVFFKSTPRGVSAIKVHMNMLLLEILAMLRGRTFKRDPALTGPLHTVRLFLDDLARNASAVGAEWTLETMAAECGMKKSSFINFCRTLTNTTPMEYLRNCRLDLAARLLRGEPAASVTDIAFRCGFNSSQYFATCFRRRFHCPPLAYRHPSFPSTVSSL